MLPWGNIIFYGFAVVPLFKYDTDAGLLMEWSRCNGRTFQQRRGHFLMLTERVLLVCLYIFEYALAHGLSILLSRPTSGARLCFGRFFVCKEQMMKQDFWQRNVPSAVTFSYNNTSACYRIFTSKFWLYNIHRRYPHTPVFWTLAEQKPHVVPVNFFPPFPCGLISFAWTQRASSGGPYY